MLMFNRFDFDVSQRYVCFQLFMEPRSSANALYIIEDYK